MTREEAIAIIENEKECVNRANKNDYCNRDCYNCELVKTDTEILTALDMAIKALEQESCEDAISRQEALDLCERFDGCVPYSVLSSYDMLPPVNPQPQESNQQLCDDVISRQAAKKALEDRFIELQKRHSVNKYETNFCLNTILELPPVTPQPKTEVLDEVRAEIEEQVLESLSDGGDDWFAAEKVNECLEIIDKYKAESEDRNDS